MSLPRGCQGRICMHTSSTCVVMCGETCLSWFILVTHESHDMMDTWQSSGTHPRLHTPMAAHTHGYTTHTHGYTHPWLQTHGRTHPWLQPRVVCHQPKHRRCRAGGELLTSTRSVHQQQHTSLLLTRWATCQAVLLRLVLGCACVAGRSAHRCDIQHLCGLEVAQRS